MLVIPHYIFYGISGLRWAWGDSDGAVRMMASVGLGVDLRGGPPDYQTQIKAFKTTETFEGHTIFTILHA